MSRIAKTGRIREIYTTQQRSAVVDALKHHDEPRSPLDSTANSGLVWGMDVVNWTLLLVRLSGGDRDESTCPVPL
jgi:hypothetical protein